ARRVGETARTFQVLRSFQPVPGLDLEVSVHPELAPLLFEGRWSECNRAARAMRGALADQGYQPDGLAVRSGPSWREPFEGFGSEPPRSGTAAGSWETPG